MNEQDAKSEQLFKAYVARFGVEPEWNLASPAQEIADMEEALRLNRPIPKEVLPPDVLI